MAQKVVGLIKLQIPAGKATPAPPVGPALGQHGVNIMAFTLRNAMALFEFYSSLVPFHEQKELRSSGKHRRCGS